MGVEIVHEVPEELRLIVS
jgi:hypothetical protein